VVQSASGKTGQAMVEGAWWNVRTSGDDLLAGATVRVIEVEGLDLVVEPTETNQDEERKENEP
jgi:membrane-bound serine protease (ClpP class)